MSVLAPYLHEPEVLGDQPAGQVRVLILRNPFTLDRSEAWVAEGDTLEGILRGLHLPGWQSAIVALDGREVTPEWWPRVRPKAEHLVTVRVIPRGGGGDSGSKGWIQIAAGVVLIAVGVILAIATWGSLSPFAVPLIMMGVGLAVSGALTLIFPPPGPPKLKDGSGGDLPVFSITGVRNQANPYGVFPRVYGRHKVYPVFLAQPYTEIVGNVQYLRLLFCFGTGPLQLTEHEIGDSPTSSFDEIEMEIRQGYITDPPITLYTNRTSEESLSIALNTVFGVTPEPERTTNGAVDEFSVDWVHTQGLFHIDADNQIVGVGTQVQIYYRQVGAGSWTLAADLTYAAQTTQPLRKSYRQVVPERAVYEIKMKQIRGSIGGHGTGSVTSGATWAILRSVLYEAPVTLPGLCLVAMRIKATDQLNGVVDTYNAIAESILPDYDASLNMWIPRATRNPASIYRDVLQGSANARPLADSQLDLAALEAWHADCELNGRTFDYVVEQDTTVAELLRLVVAVGRATLGSVDGTFGVVRDIPQTVPVQHFTPRNSRNFTLSKIFRDIPHGLKCRFINPDAGWEMDERIVYDTGYDEESASKFEAMTFLGVTSADQAYKLGRYHLAQARLRPETYSFEADVEHLVCTRGDLIRVTHDVPLWGIKSGRLKSVTLNGSSEATAVTVDETIPMELGGTYNIRIRRADASSVVADVVTVVGEVKALTFVTPIPAASAPAAGDLFMFGATTSESVEAIVTRIEMLRDLGARITCVDAAPAIHDADTGLIPEHDPQITIPPENRIPPAPTIYGLVSEGTLVSRATGTSIGTRISVQWTLPGAEALDGARMQAGWRESGLLTTAPWTRVPEEPAADATALVIGPLSPGTTVDIRLRTVSKYGRPSEWVVVTLIELPNPPVTVLYTLTPVAGGYLAQIERRLGPPPPPRVTGLRLVNSLTGSPNDTDFAGTEAKFIWNAISLFPGLGDGEDDITQDTEIRDYLVEILTSDTLRHTATVAMPGFTYVYEQNLEDHAGVPSRTLTIRVRARGHDGQLSVQPAELTVQNPAPDMSQIVPQVTALSEGVVVDWKAYLSADHDLSKFAVLVGTVSPPLTVAITRSAEHREAIIPSLVSGVEIFVQVVPYDVFGAGTGSVIVSTTPLSSATVDMFARSFTPEDITFSYDPDTRTMSWTGGTLRWTVNGIDVLSRQIAAGSASV